MNIHLRHPFSDIKVKECFPAVAGIIDFLSMNDWDKFNDFHSQLNREDLERVQLSNYIPPNI